MITPARAFWERTAAAPLLEMMDSCGYTPAARLVVENWLARHVLPHLGPPPRGYSAEAPPLSFMCDDGSPIEFSWAVDRIGKSTVRFAVEPLVGLSRGAIPAGNPRALLDAMRADGTVADIDMHWFDVCADALTLDRDSTAWRALMSHGALSHLSQYFIGYDVTRSGEPALKAYFVPRLRAVASGKSQDALIGDACMQLGLQTPWTVLGEFLGRCAVAPSLDIVAIDFVPAAQNRMKVYVRLTLEQMTFADLREFFTLGGRLHSQAIDDALEALWSLWKLLFGSSSAARSKTVQDRRRVVPLHNGSAPTAALCMYYDLRQGSALPAPKVYIPVRHYCANDSAISTALERFFSLRGNLNGARLHGEHFRRIFKHVRPERTIGIHTYVACAVKRGDYEISTYYSPSAFSQ